MKRKKKRFIKRLLDGRDRSVEAHAFLVVIAFISLVAFTGFSVWKTGTFDPNSFGEAVGLILGGGGFAAIGQSVLDRGDKNGN